jgi:hypothetical protein
MSRVRPIVLDVAVFGLLDEVVKYEELTWTWAATVPACAVVLLVAGMVFKLLEKA